LKALWLNDNPVVKNCDNFSTIGNSFPKLEILNGELTSRAGEWAICYLARGTGAGELDKITYLNARGKNLLTVTELGFVKQMRSLVTLDISDNMNMYKTNEMLLAEAQQMNG